MVATEKDVDKEVERLKEGREEMAGETGGNGNDGWKLKKNGSGSNPFVVFVVVWVRDALGPQGTSSSYHSEQTAGTSFSLLASQL